MGALHPQIFHLSQPSSQAFLLFWGAPVSQRNVIWHCQAPGSGQEPTVVVERHGYWIHWSDWESLGKVGLLKVEGSEGMFAGSLENSSLASEMSSSKILLLERIPQSRRISHILAIKNRLKWIISKRTFQKILGNLTQLVEKKHMAPLDFLLWLFMESSQSPNSFLKQRPGIPQISGAPNTPPEASPFWPFSNLGSSVGTFFGRFPKWKIFQPKRSTHPKIQITNTETLETITNRLICILYRHSTPSKKSYKNGSSGNILKLWSQNSLVLKWICIPECATLEFIKLLELFRCAKIA